jgi:hypothetical protein
MHATVNIRIGVQERMQNMKEWVEEHEGTLGITTSDMNRIQDAKKEINEIIKELELLRRSSGF